MSAEQGEDLDLYWAAFLKHTNTTIRTLQDLAMLAAKDFGHRFRNAWSGDPIVNYLYHARNADEHRTEPVALIDAKTVSIGNGALELTNCDGIEFVNVSFDLGDAGKHSLSGTATLDVHGNPVLDVETTAPIQVREVSFQLSDVHNQQGSAISVPSSRTSGKAAARDFGEHTIDFLEKHYSELTNILEAST